MRSAEQFLRKARLRWMVWRMIESAGVCAAVGAGVGLIIVPILLWRDQPALSAAIVLLITGICAGLLWALLHQPTILQTAIEIDQQFDLHDLLSTAARFDRSQDQAFAAIVLAQAAKCCGEISPNELILRRLGSRAWGGIGIISALLLTLAMFSAHPPLSQADANSTSQSANALPQSNDDSNNSMSAALVDAKPDLITDRQLSDGKSSTDADDATSSSDDSKSRQSATRFDSRESGGAAAGHSDDAKTSSLDPFTVRNQSRSTTGLPATAGGIGSSENVGPHDSAKIAGFSNTSASQRTAAWQSDQLPADRASVLQAVETGQIPDACRDLVRNYFDLPQSTNH